MTRRAFTALGLALTFAPAPARAALTFHYGCGESNFECAHLTVPLDRSGAVPGHVKLYIERATSPAKGPHGAVFAIAGGPGQGADTLTENFNTDLSGSIGARDMVVIDQRGTGKSGALNCPELERPGDQPIDVRTAACADRLGAARSHYTTRDSVADFEAVRAALGVDRITLFGVSYGTKVAVAYAMAYPEHVERLVLDSVVDPLQDDALELDSYAALPRALAEICRGECDAFTHDLAGDTAGLVAAMRAKPLRGPFVDSRGVRRTKSVTPRELYESIRAGDLDPGVRAEYPAAIHAAAAGDPAPLIRMEHRYDDLALTPLPPDESQVQSLSFTLQAATLCEEAPLPWERTATPAERDQQARQHAAAVPDAAFAPFDREVALTADSNSLLFQCRRWPALAAAPALLGTPPDVPVLVLEGLADTRTPLEVGARVAARFPQAQIVTVPKTGHAVLGRTPCAVVAVKRFFGGTPVGSPCAKLRRRVGVLPEAPTSLAVLAPAPGTAGRAGRTLAAVLRTLVDLDREFGARLFGPRRGGGLRAGRFALRHGVLEVRGFSYVPGVTINGDLKAAFNGRITGTFSVAGAAAVTGTMVLTRKGTVAGTLGGRRVQGHYTRPPSPFA